MFKMEKLNIVRYVDDEKERQRLMQQGYKEVEIKETPVKRGGKNGEGKA